MHLEKLLNILHYCFYAINVKLYFLFLKVTRLDRIFEIPFLKRRYKKLKQDPLKYLIYFETNKYSSDSIINSGGLLVGSIMIIMFSLSFTLKGVYELENNSLLGLFFIFLIPSFLICYFFVFKKDKYLEYFDEFEKWPRNIKRKNVLLSIGYVFGVTNFFFWSLFHS